MKVPSSAVLVGWFGFLWSLGTSVVVALTLQEVRAAGLVIPVLATALLPIAAAVGTTARIKLGIGALLILLAFIGLAMLSIGWFYLPSFFTAVAVTTAAERDARRMPS